MHVVASSHAYLYVYRMKWVKMCVAARACFLAHSGIRSLLRSDRQSLYGHKSV